MVFMMFKAIHIELICLAIISALYFLVFALIVPLYKWHLTRFRPHVLSESHWVKRLEHHNMLLMQLIVLFLVPTLLLSLFDILGHLFIMHYITPLYLLFSCAYFGLILFIAIDAPLCKKICYNSLIISLFFLHIILFFVIFFE